MGLLFTIKVYVLDLTHQTLLQLSQHYIQGYLFNVCSDFDPNDFQTFLVFLLEYQEISNYNFGPLINIITEVLRHLESRSISSVHCKDCVLDVNLAGRCQPRIDKI